MLMSSTLIFIAIVRNISYWVADCSFLIMAIKFLNIQASSTIMSSKLTYSRSWFKSLILSSRSALSVKMLSQISTWRLNLSNNVTSVVGVSTSTLYTYLSMSHIHMIDVILWMECSLSSVLIFEDFC